jgi:MinD superfamily P-loop ATPase
MKQIAIVSGKGGTGKTSITAAVIHLLSAHATVIAADCDVDASDLHLILNPRKIIDTVFASGLKASINETNCIGCGRYLPVCRFNAIKSCKPIYGIDEYLCEGCAACEFVCQVKAIHLSEPECGAWYISETRFGSMVHARLHPGAENSGKLVTMVRHQAQRLAEDKNAAAIVIDGPPGIGCPVIATLTGIDTAIAVVEPTVSGIHDFQRLKQLADHFRVPLKVGINKFDINLDQTGVIEAYCRDHDIEVLFRIPFTPDFLKAQINRQTITEYNPRYADLLAPVKRICL